MGLVQPQPFPSLARWGTNVHRGIEGFLIARFPLTLLHFHWICTLSIIFPQKPRVAKSGCVSVFKMTLMWLRRIFYSSYFSTFKFLEKISWNSKDKRLFFHHLRAPLIFFIEQCCALPISRVLGPVPRGLFIPRFDFRIFVIFFLASLIGSDWVNVQTQFCPFFRSFLHHSSSKLWVTHFLWVHESLRSLCFLCQNPSN